MKSHILRGSVLAGMLVAVPAMVSATSVPENLSVTITINATCVAGTSTAVAFAASGYLTSNVDAAGAIQYGCTKGTTPAVTLDAGGNSGGTCPDTRCMLDSVSGDLVGYELYTNAPRTTPWVAGTTSVTGPAGDGSLNAGAPDTNKSVPVYGRVPPQTTPTPGNYSDTVVATITF